MTFAVGGTFNPNQRKYVFRKRGSYILELMLVSKLGTENRDSGERKLFCHMQFKFTFHDISVCEMLGASL